MTATNTLAVLSPMSTTFTPSKSRPPRPTSLADLRPGILENSKANAKLLMETFVEHLRGSNALGELTVGHKGGDVAAGPREGRAAQGELRLRAGRDWRLRIVHRLYRSRRGDAGGSRDPHGRIGTDIFEEQFRREAEQLGMPGIPFVPIPDPLGGLKPDAVRTKAATAIQRLEEALIYG